MRARSSGQLVCERRPPSRTVSPIVRSAKHVPATSFFPLRSGTSSSPAWVREPKVTLPVSADLSFPLPPFGRFLSCHLRAGASRERSTITCAGTVMLSTLIRRAPTIARNALIDLRYGGLLAGTDRTRFGHLGAHDVGNAAYGDLDLLFAGVAVGPDDVAVDIG